MPSLSHNSYGKSRVRFLKTIRHTPTHHDICEIEADILLSGDLSGSFLSDDNSSIIPTDTCKNTLHLLAHDHLQTCRNSFARVVGGHFLEKYSHLSLVEIDLRERLWDRLTIDGHTFSHNANGIPFSNLKNCLTKGETLVSGIRNRLILKTTASSFSGFNTCDLTTLAPTEDRILSTRLTASWTYSDLSANFMEADNLILAALLKIFAENHSPSVQRTAYQMAEAALAASPAISAIHLTLPNVHFLPLDLTKLGRAGQTILTLPTDEPHGVIHATLTR
ncbi:MAG: urate oxidase [Armatimonadetes bacterium]|nr:urate oxidase [Akkermansiaceae bacterium]